MLLSLKGQCHCCRPEIDWYIHIDTGLISAETDFYLWKEVEFKPKNKTKLESTFGGVNVCWGFYTVYKGSIVCMKSIQNGRENMAGWGEIYVINLSQTERPSMVGYRAPLCFRLSPFTIVVLSLECVMPKND